MLQDNIPQIWNELEKCQFKVSTDTRKDVTGSIYFALKGESFDGNTFIHEALKKGSLGAVTDNPEITGENIYLVDNSLEILQTIATRYRKLFNTLIIAIGGSNGKTTSKELIRQVLEAKYKVHTSKENFNNHIGVPLSILSMNPEVEIGLFEIGANHSGEHTKLLNILEPTIVIVTNNGMDHLEGFKSPLGVREANKEMYDWALLHKSLAFVNKNYPDLMKDSENLERILYPVQELSITRSMPLTLSSENQEYVTHLVGDYNIENIHLALAVGIHFKIDTDKALTAICQYLPSAKRSQFLEKGAVKFVIDCYNANPSSMHLSLESFLKSAQSPRGLILGDMLELGSYSEEEHRKIVEYISKQKVDCVVFIGENFKKALIDKDLKYQWFPDSLKAHEWFNSQGFKGFAFLLKGSRGVKVEQILDL